MGESRGIYRVLVGILKGKRTLGRSRRRWEDNIEIGLQEVGWGYGLDRFQSEWEKVAAVVNAVMNLMFT